MYSRKLEYARALLAGFFVRARYKFLENNYTNCARMRSYGDVTEIEVLEMARKHPQKQ